MAVPIGSWIGNYRVLELLGSGGMGEVYLVEEARTARRRAMKTLRSGDPNSDVWRRFFNEGRVQHEVSHPNIVAFHEMFLCDDRPCLVMEFVDGESLFSRIQSTGALEVEESLRVLEQLCDALAYLHSRGILHRDIKSANVKIDSKGVVKLLDFGIARSPRARGMTMAGAVMGTPEHLAPEQIAGLPADSRSEVWSLGLLGYEMLTGRLPFTAGDDFALFHAIRSADPPSPSTLRPAVPPEVSAMVMRCLDKRPSRRYQTPAELRTAIGKARNVYPGSPAPPAIASPWLARARRLPLAVQLSAIAAPAVLILLLYAISSGTSGDVRTITVEVVEGSADVYAGGSRVGRTPYRTRVHVGDTVSLELRQEGYLDQPVQFDVTERKTYSYAMQPDGALR